MSTEQELRRELLVWGYIREFEREYSIENIPEDINSIILLFQKICDLWDRQYSHGSIEIDEDGTSFTVVGSGLPTAYGAAIVKDGTYSWKIKIEDIGDKNNGPNAPYVGIIVNEQDHLVNYKGWDGWDDYGYQLLGDTGHLYCMGDDIQLETYKCQWSDTGDVLEIVLNIDAQTIMFTVNDNKKEAVFYENVAKEEYRLALTVEGYKGAKFSFL